MGINSPSTRNFIRLENILIIGNGGRENSLAWAIQKNELVKKVYLIPGNAGSERINKCERIKIDINNKNELIYEGKAKKVFTHDDANKVKIEFKDEATAFNALKKKNLKVKANLIA